MMDIFYVNSRNQKINFLESPYWLQTGDIFDYSWNANELNNKIVSFTKGVTERSLTLSVLNFGRHNYEEAINELYEVVDYDVLNVTRGKLYVGGQYLRCYIKASKKSEWEYGIECMDVELEIITDYDFWIREHEYQFKITDITSTNNKRYPNKYPYRYANGLSNLSLVNPHFTESNFKMIFYGPVSKPIVNVGGYPYFVDTILEENERIEIDSASETVCKVMRSGMVVSLFHNRARKNSVFRPIQTGYQEVSWIGTFPFDIILYEERSEPKW